MAYKKVVFNAGNPLDVNELNQLSANITESIDAATSQLQSSINEQGELVKKFAIVSCGQAEVLEMKKGIYGQSRVTIPSSPFAKSPIVTVTVAEDITTEDIDIFVLSQSANEFIIKAKSTGDKRTKLKVNWIASQLQDIKTT